MNTNKLTGPWIWDIVGLCLQRKIMQFHSKQIGTLPGDHNQPGGPATERTHMKYFVLRKFKYIRGFEHDMPAVEKCKNGFDKLEDALEAKTCLEHLEHRPDMVSFVIVRETNAKN